MSKWRNPPPVCVLSGSEGYLRRRELNEAIRVCGEEGRIVEIADGSDSDKIGEILSTTGGVLFDDKYLVVVENPEKVDHELILSHHKSGDNSAAIILNIDGEIKVKTSAGKIAKALPDKLVAKYTAPPPWKRDGWARDKLLEESVERNVKLSPQVAQGIVAAVGTDLGLLMFELEKAALLAKARGTDVLSVEILRETLAPFSEASALPVVDAFGARSPKHLGRALAHVRRTTGGAKSAAVMRVIGLLAVNVVKWLHIRCLVDSGVKAVDISTQTGLNKFVLIEKVFPLVRKWDQDSLVEVLRSLAEVERGIRSGWVDPWSVFEARLLAAVS